MSGELSFDDAQRIAGGCLDYSGGYGRFPELAEAYRAGIRTVMAALDGAASAGLADPQTRALHEMGSCDVKRERDRLKALNAELLGIVSRLAGLGEGLANGNSSTELAAVRLAEVARDVAAKATEVQS